MATETLGVENLDAHRAVNRSLDVSAKNPAGSSTRQQLERIARAPADGPEAEFRAHRARLVLDYRTAAPCAARLGALEQSLGPHPTLGRPGDSCTRPSVRCASNKTGRCSYESPNLQSFDRDGVRFRRMVKPSLHASGYAVVRDGLPALKVCCLNATVTAESPLGSVSYGVLARLTDRTMADFMEGGSDRGTCAAYWTNAAARGYAWSYAGAWAGVRQVVVRIRGRELTFPGDRVYDLEAGPRWPAPPPQPLPAAETEHDRVTPFAAPVLVEPRRLVLARRGCALLSADLAQNELRVAAQLSGDPCLRGLFNGAGGDPFADTARRLARARGGGEPDRAAAKQVVYAVLYGASTRELAHRLETDAAGAARAVSLVRRLMPRLESFRARVAADLRETRYVETLMGKRRALPKILSTDRKKVSRAERQALNTLCQGSAADLVKVAMAECVGRFAQIPDPRDRPRLVLQLHDELVFEVPERRVAATAAAVKDVLEVAVTLDDVRTEARIATGANWADLAPYPPG